MNVNDVAVLFAAVCVWYSSSAVANTTSRKLLNLTGTPIFLTFVQFLVSSVLLEAYNAFLILFAHVTNNTYSGLRKGSSGAVLPSVRSLLTETHGGKEKEAIYVIWKLALVYTAGFVFVNAGYVMVNVSLAETLRSAEPLFSVFLAKFYLPKGSENITFLVTLSMFPIFFGGVLSSLSDTSFSVLGLLLVCCSNLSFSLRSLYTKQLKQSLGDVDPFELFLMISKLGVIFLFFLMIIQSLLGLGPNFSRINDQLLSENNADNNLLKLALINAICYFLYNQMSFFVLSKVTMISHAVTNALRRVVTIAFSVWYFRNNITALNAFGILLALSGVLLYSYAKSAPARPSTSVPAATKTDLDDEDIEPGNAEDSSRVELEKEAFMKRSS